MRVYNLLYPPLSLLGMESTTQKKCPICNSVICWKYNKITSKAEHDANYDRQLYRNPSGF